MLKIVFITTTLLFEGNSLIIKDKTNNTFDVNEDNLDYETEDNISDQFLNVSTLFGKTHEAVNTGAYPNFYDWRDKDCVSPVKDQKECGACWAFSAVANIESQIKIQLGRKEILSEQFLLDCDDSNNGCASASLLKTFANIVSRFNGVLRLQDYHPYEARRMECRWNGTPRPVPVIGYKRVKQDEELMAKALFKYGPLSAAINSASMDKYKGNYIDEPSDNDCSPDPKKMDHAILIVGYNAYVSNKTGKTVPYWIIKNSWGDKWGDKGFYYLVRGRNACGIANDVSFAFVN